MLFLGGIEFPISVAQLLEIRVKLVLKWSIVYFTPVHNALFHFFSFLTMAAHMEGNVIERRDHSRYRT